jgi:hypothetical protein
MPELSKVEQALSENFRSMRRPIPRHLLHPEPEVMRWQLEKDAAPLVTRNAALEMVKEGRTTRWARFAVAVPIILFVLDRLL